MLLILGLERCQDYAAEFQSLSLGSLATEAATHWNYPEQYQIFFWFS